MRGKIAKLFFYQNYITCSYQSGRREKIQVNIWSMPTRL